MSPVIPKEKDSVQRKKTNSNPTWKKHVTLYYRKVLYVTVSNLKIIIIMEKPKKKRIKLAVEIDIYKKNHKEKDKQSDINLLDSNVLPYDTLRIIFRHLNGRDLSNVAMVCR